MILYATFDSEALDFLQGMVDQAWLDLPPDKRTIQIKERMAEAVMRSAHEGERDPARLDAIAVIAAIARYDFEVTRGDQIISSRRSVELPDLRAVWGQIAELTEDISLPECRIRVFDQSGEMVISIGVATARVLQTA